MSAASRLSLRNRFRGLRTEKDAAERRDRIVGYFLVVLACGYALFELGVAVEQYGSDRESTQAAEAIKARAEKMRAYGLLADCLNGRAIMVRGQNAAIFCDRASYQGGL